MPPKCCWASSRAATDSEPLACQPAPESSDSTRGAKNPSVLTEIDLASTLNAKLDVDLPPQVILGACRPPLAYEAIQADPAIATVLPCNVVVRSTGDRTTVVEALDPWVMLGVGDDRALRAVAADARQRLVAALATVGGAS